MNKIITNINYHDTLNLGVKVVRVEFSEDYTKLDLGFLYSEKRKNVIKITEKIILSDYSDKRKLIECEGINLNEEVKLKSIKDFRYFSLKFAPFEDIRERLFLIQNDEQFGSIIMSIEKS